MLTICCCPIAVLAIVGCCRALLSLLPEHWLWPDVGPVLGCRGMLDFVLMPPQYGFEQVRGPMTFWRIKKGTSSLLLL